MYFNKNYSNPEFRIQTSESTAADDTEKVRSKGVRICILFPESKNRKNAEDSQWQDIIKAQITITKGIECVNVEWKEMSWK